MSTKSGSDPHLHDPHLLPEGVRRVSWSLQACGDRHAVFNPTPADLQSLTGVPVRDVVEVVELVATP